MSYRALNCSPYPEGSIVGNPWWKTPQSRLDGFALFAYEVIVHQSDFSVTCKICILFGNWLEKVVEFGSCDDVFKCTWNRHCGRGEGRIVDWRSGQSMVLRRSIELSEDTKCKTQTLQLSQANCRKVCRSCRLPKSRIDVR